jgi:hypothetical protein
MAANVPPQCPKAITQNEPYGAGAGGAWGWASARTADIRAEPIGAYVTSSDQLPNSCDSMGSLLRATHATGPPQARLGDRSAVSALLSCPDAPSASLRLDPAAFIHVSFSAETRHHCHLIGAFRIEQVHEILWSLGDSNP